MSQTLLMDNDHAIEVGDLISFHCTKLMKVKNRFKSKRKFQLVSCKKQFKVTVTVGGGVIYENRY